MYVTSCSRRQIFC